MIVNGQRLLDAAPIKNMVTRKMVAPGGVTFGLGEAGYDIRLKQHLTFNPYPESGIAPCITETLGDDCVKITEGRFTIASAIEEFKMPDNLVGRVCDKSTWARQGLSVFNTVIEPGWFGFLTLELVYHGIRKLELPAGTAIAQVLFEEISEPRQYTGRYQNQKNAPVRSKYIPE